MPTTLGCGRQNGHVECLLLLVGQTAAARLLAALKFSLLIGFAVSRFRVASIQPPNTLWIIFALMSAVLGNLGRALIDWHPLLPGAETIFRLGSALASRGFLTGLFIGVGSRLIPMFTGMKTAPLKINRILHPLHPWLAAVFFVALILEPWQLRLALGIQAMAVTIEVAYLWRMHQLPSRGSRAVTLYLSSWLLVLASLGAALFPNLRSDFFHLIFIGVFLAGTVAVASHVLVMHDNMPQTLLSRFWPLGATTGLIFLAALTRATAKTASYWDHLGYAAISIWLALLLWGIYWLIRPYGSSPATTISAQRHSD